MAYSFVNKSVNVMLMRVGQRAKSKEQATLNKST